MTLIFLELSKSYMHYKKFRHHLKEKVKFANSTPEVTIMSGLVGIFQALLVSFCFPVSVTHRLILI